MASTRFKGEYDSDILNVSGVKSRDMIQARHGVKIISEDSDKAIPFEVLQARPVAVCTSAAATGTKTATLTDSFPDFTLINGREIIVYMANANTAAEPSLLITGTEAIPLECNSWNAGTFLRCKYVDITINGTRVRKWLVDTGYANTTSQLNGALTNLADYSNYEVYTGAKWKDGKWIYKKTYSYPLSFITANTWSNIEGGQTQIDTIVKAELTCGNTSFSGFICQVTSGLLRMYSPVGVNLTDFTVWYTKN